MKEYRTWNGNILDNTNHEYRCFVERLSNSQGREILQFYVSNNNYTWVGTCSAAHLLTKSVAPINGTSLGAKVLSLLHNSGKNLIVKRRENSDELVIQVVAPWGRDYGISGLLLTVAEITLSEETHGIHASAITTALLRERALQHKRSKAIAAAEARIQEISSGLTLVESDAVEQARAQALAKALSLYKEHLAAKRTHHNPKENIA